MSSDGSEWIVVVMFRVAECQLNEVTNVGDVEARFGRVYSVRSNVLVIALAQLKFTG